MKVKITKRVVFHKIAETTIDVPDNISKFEMDEYLTDHEHIYDEQLHTALQDAKTEFGFGLGDGMVDEDAEVEERYDILDDNGKPIYGGHI
jgi:hypothetical protein